MASIKRNEKKNGEVVYRIQISLGCDPRTGKRIPKVITFTQESAGKITVVFADGTRRLMDGGECIDLVMDDTANIGRFEGGSGCGCLTDLLNGLLEV